MIWKIFNFNQQLLHPLNFHNFTIFQNIYIFHNFYRNFYIIDQQLFFIVEYIFSFSNAQQYCGWEIWSLFSIVQHIGHSDCYEDKNFLEYNSSPIVSLKVEIVEPTNICCRETRTFYCPMSSLLGLVQATNLIVSFCVGTLWIKYVCFCLDQMIFYP